MMGTIRSQWVCEEGPRGHSTKPTSQLTFTSRRSGILISYIQLQCFGSSLGGKDRKECCRPAVIPMLTQRSFEGRYAGRRGLEVYEGTRWKANVVRATALRSPWRRNWGCKDGALALSLPVCRSARIDNTGLMKDGPHADTSSDRLPTEPLSPTLGKLPPPHGQLKVRWANRDVGLSLLKRGKSLVSPCVRLPMQLWLFLCPNNSGFPKSWFAFT